MDLVPFKAYLTNGQISKCKTGTEGRRICFQNIETGWTLQAKEVVFWTLGLEIEQLRADTHLMAQLEAHAPAPGSTAELSAKHWRKVMVQKRLLMYLCTEMIVALQGHCFITQSDAGIARSVQTMVRPWPASL